MPAPVWCPRRSRFLRFDSLSLGNSHGVLESRQWSGARARPVIQIGPTARAKPAAIFPAERKRIHRQRQLLAHRRLDIHPRQRFGQRIHAGIVLEIRVGENSTSTA